MALLLGALLFPRLFHGYLRHWDEAWYAQVSREMLQTGDWLTLHWNYEPWFHKPPLFFWATASIFKLLGQTEFSARLFPFLCSLICVSIVACDANRHFGRTTAWIAALLLISIPDFARYSTRGQLDVPLTLCISAALICFQRALDRPHLHWVAGILLGLAVMTKGAAAGLIIVVQVTYMILCRVWRPFTQYQWWASILIALAIAAPWHLQQISLHGQDFVTAYFSRHFAQFFVDIYPEVDHAPPPASYYLEYLLGKQRPFGWLLLALIVAGGWQAWKARERTMAFYWCWTAVPIMALSLAHTKWSWYLVPVYPGAAMLAVSCAGQWLSPRGKHWLLATAALLAVGTATEPLWSAGNREYEDKIAPLRVEVQKWVPAGVPIHTLQMPRASESVYPIAVLYYCERPVQVAHGLEHFAEVCRRSQAVFYALIHESQRQPLEKLSLQPVNDQWFVIEPVTSSGPIQFLRIVPGYLAEQIYGTRRE